jgi:hypothetical protein
MIMCVNLMFANYTKDVPSEPHHLLEGLIQGPIASFIGKQRYSSKFDHKYSAPELLPIRTHPNIRGGHHSIR